MLRQQLASSRDEEIQRLFMSLRSHRVNYKTIMESKEIKPEIKSVRITNTNLSPKPLFICRVSFFCSFTVETFKKNRCTLEMMTEKQRIDFLEAAAAFFSIEKENNVSALFRFITS